MASVLRRTTFLVCGRCNLAASGRSPRHLRPLIRPRAPAFPPMSPLATTSLPRPLRAFSEDDPTSLASPPAEVNYFELFEVPESFDLDARTLQKKFRQLQGLFHPDRFGQSSPEQRAYSEMWSTHANRGYNQLLKPLDRALYLLELRGNPLEEGEVATEAAFLAEVMEANEEVAEAESPADLAALSKHNLSILSEYVDRVSAAFRKGDVRLAKEEVARMKYYSNLQDKIVERELEMGVV